MSVKPIVVAVMWVIAFFPAADAADPAESPSDERQQIINLESFDRVWTTIRDSHWDSEMGGIDWEARWRTASARLWGPTPCEARWMKSSSPGAP